MKLISLSCSPREVFRKSPGCSAVTRTCRRIIWKSRITSVRPPKLKKDPHREARWEHAFTNGFYIVSLSLNRVCSKVSPGRLPHVQTARTTHPSQYVCVQYVVCYILHIFAEAQTFVFTSHATLGLFFYFTEAAGCLLQLRRDQEEIQRFCKQSVLSAYNNNFDSIYTASVRDPRTLYNI